MAAGLFLAIGCSGVETPAPTSANDTPQALDQADGRREVEQSDAAAEAPPSEPPNAGSVSPAPELVKETVRADDGHELALWAKVPPNPRGAIILLHGRTWSSRPDFDLQSPGEDRSTMDALAREGFAAYALDLRGYGSTPRDSTGWNTPERAQKDLAAAISVVTKNHGAPPAVLGWSLGALTAQFAAQRNPESISALILFGYPRSPDHRYKADKSPKGDPAMAKTTAKAAAEDFIAPGVMSKQGSDAFVAACLEHDPVRADWTKMSEWAELAPEKVKTPTLLIHGELDPYAPEKTQAKLFARLGHPDRAWVIVAGGDHAAHLEDTGPRFVQAVVSFLERPLLR